MPRKRGKGKGKDHPPTMRMRVRAKNPQIGRRMDDSESATVHADLEDSVRGNPDSTDPVVIDPDETPQMFDDDATEVVGRPPPIPKQDLIVRSVGGSKKDKSKPKAARPPPVAPSTTERPPNRKKRPKRSSLHDSPVMRPSLASNTSSPFRDPNVSGSDVTAPLPQVKPRSRMILKGTKAAGALAQEVRVRKIENAQTPTQFPELKLVRSALSREEVENLEQALSGKKERRDLTSAAHSPKRTLEKLIYADEYTALGIKDRAQILKAVAQDNRDLDTMNAARKLVETNVISELDPRDRRTLLATFIALRGKDRGDLAYLAARRLHGRSAVFDRDFEDTSVLDHVLAIATAKRLAPQLAQSGIRKKHVMAMMMSSLARPPSLPLEDEGDGVLGMFEFGMAESAPAELARIWRCLSTKDMVVRLPDEGVIDLAGVIRTQPGLSLTGTNTPIRVAFEQLIALAHPRSGARRGALIMPGGESIDADITARALGYLYGVGFSVGAGATNAIRYLEECSTSPHRVPPIYVTILHERGESLFVFDRIDEHDVYIRAPHGASSKPRGSRRLDPLRTVDEPERGVDRLPRSAFVEYVGVALVPRT